MTVQGYGLRGAMIATGAALATALPGVVAVVTPLGARAFFPLSTELGRFEARLRSSLLNERWCAIRTLALATACMVHAASSPLLLRAIVRGELTRSPWLFASPLLAYAIVGAAVYFSAQRTRALGRIARSVLADRHPAFVVVPQVSTAHYGLASDVRDERISSPRVAVRARSPSKT